MDALKRLFGMDVPESRPSREYGRRQALSPDEQAVERYRYLLRTAPPETIEEAHVEGFSKLNQEQRQMVLQELSASLTPAERAAGVAPDTDPRSLARLATRAEMRQPGTLERTWSGMPAMGGGMGGMGGGGFMNNFMGIFAGVMVGNLIADAFIGNSGGDPGAGDSSGAGEASGMEGGDAGGGDAGGGDFGGGDFGGGDFGGFGDFGGGDF